MLLGSSADGSPARSTRYLTCSLSDQRRLTSVFDVTVRITIPRLTLPPAPQSPYIHSTDSTSPSPRRLPMRTMLLALATVAAAAALDVGAAQAQNYPFCLITGPGRRLQIRHLSAVPGDSLGHRLLLPAELRPRAIQRRNGLWQRLRTPGAALSRLRPAILTRCSSAMRSG